MSEGVPVQLTPEDIQSFIEAWAKDWGEQLTPETADSEAKRLIHFFLTLTEARLDTPIKE